MMNKKELNVEEMEQVNGGLIVTPMGCEECTETAKLKLANNELTNAPQLPPIIAPTD